MVTPPMVVCRISKAPCLHGQPIKEDDVEHDPADGEKAGHGSQDGGAQRHPGRHGEQKNRNEVGNDERNDRRDMRLDLVACDQDQQRHDRKRGRDGRQRPDW